MHHVSRKGRRVTRSSMTAELLALAEGYDQSFVVKCLLEQTLWGVNEN